jgi:hypothetical protein
MLMLFELREELVALFQKFAMCLVVVGFQCGLPARSQPHALLLTQLPGEELRSGIHTSHRPLPAVRQSVRL